MFKRRVTPSRFKKVSVSTTTQKSPNSSKLPIKDEISDQGVDSSIQKITKDPHNFNQSIEDVAGLLQQFSNAPLRPERLPYTKSLKNEENHKVSSTRVPTTRKALSTTTQRINHHDQFIEEIYYTKPSTSRSVFEDAFELVTLRQNRFNPTTANQRKDSIVRTQHPNSFQKIAKPSSHFTHSTTKSNRDYDYYDDGDERILGRLNAQVRFFLQVTCFYFLNFIHFSGQSNNP